MKRLTRRGLSKRIFAGERKAEMLIQWLNENRGTPHYKRVIPLLKDIIQFGRICQEPQFKPLIDPKADMQFENIPSEEIGGLLVLGLKFSEKARAAGLELDLEDPLEIPLELVKEAYQESLQEQTHKVECHEPRAPEELLAARINQRLVRYRMYPQIFVAGGKSGEGSMGFLWRAQRDRAAAAIPDIVRLAEGGYIERVRQCAECEKWLFARFADQKFCTQKCQQKYHTTSEKGKARRREYMREYMRTYKALKDSGKVK